MQEKESVLFLFEEETTIQENEKKLDRQLSLHYSSPPSPSTSCNTPNLPPQKERRVIRKLTFERVRSLSLHSSFSNPDRH